MTRKNNLLMTGLLVMLSVGTAYAAPASAPVTDTSRSLTLVSDARDVVHDESSGTVIHSTSGACVRTKWMSPDDVCAPAEAPVAQVPPPPPSVTQISREDRTVYFAFNQTTLSPEMKQRLDSLATRLKSEKSVRGAHIVGYADRIGNAGYNEKLSQKRAEVVKKYLVSRGIINTQVAETRWEGSSASVTHCPSNLKKPQLIQCLQGDRRVEAEIDYAPDHAQ